MKPKRLTSLNTEGFGDALKLIKQCPVCKQEYNKEDLTVIEDSANSYLLHLDCSHCQQSLQVLVAITQLGMSAIALVTDLDAADVERIRKKSLLTEDDVLGFHTYISRGRKFSQDLIKNIRNLT
jgi:hypothetical protein